MILGWHHITLICADAARTIDFYTRILGLHLIRKTVNFDAPESYALYFGTYEGAVEGIITFFELKLPLLLP
jgi:glyoxalase family protein